MMKQISESLTLQDIVMHDPQFLFDFICALKIFTKVPRCPETGTYVWWCYVERLCEAKRKIPSGYAEGAFEEYVIDKIILYNFYG